MRPKKHETTGSGDLFRARLDQIINMRHELVQLAGKIDWEFIDGEIAPLYSEGGRPGIATQFVIGLFFLKQIGSEYRNSRATAGSRGERGLIGPRGEPAPTITGWRVDRAAYSAVPLLSDGSEGAPLELRDLFKQFLDEVAAAPLDERGLINVRFCPHCGLKSDISRGPRSANNGHTAAPLETPRPALM